MTVTKEEKAAKLAKAIAAAKAHQEEQAKARTLAKAAPPPHAPAEGHTMPEDPGSKKIEQDETKLANIQAGVDEKTTTEARKEGDDEQTEKGCGPSVVKAPLSKGLGDWLAKAGEEGDAGPSSGADDAAEDDKKEKAAEDKVAQETGDTDPAQDAAKEKMQERMDKARHGFTGTPKLTTGTTEPAEPGERKEPSLPEAPPPTKEAQVQRATPPSKVNKVMPNAKPVRGKPAVASKAPPEENGQQGAIAAQDKPAPVPAPVKKSLGLGEWLSKAVPDMTILPIPMGEDTDDGGGTADGDVDAVTLMQPAWQDNEAQWDIDRLAVEAVDEEEGVQKGVFIGPNGGKWDDAAHKRHHTEGGAPSGTSTPNHVLGKTTSGKDIHQDHKHPDHAAFTAHDHLDAVKVQESQRSQAINLARKAPAGSAKATALYGEANHAADAATHHADAARAAHPGTSAGAKALHDAANVATKTADKKGTADAHFKAARAHQAAADAHAPLDHAGRKWPGGYETAGKHADHVKQAAEHHDKGTTMQRAALAANIKKSEGDMDGLSGWLKKAGIPGAADESGGVAQHDWKEGTPDIEPGEQANGHWMGGDGEKSPPPSDGTHIRNQRPGGGKSEGIPGTEGAPSVDSESLSADDGPVGKMPTGEPGVVTVKVPVPEASMEKGNLRNVEDEVAASRNAALRKAAIEGSKSIRVGQDGVRFTAPAVPEAPKPLLKGLGAAVYSDGEDQQIAAMLEKGQGYYGGGSAPSIPAVSMLRKSACGNCGAPQPAWLTRCGNCGVDAGGGNMVKAEAPRGRLTLRQANVLRLPNGATIPKV
jgi:hypothetical protein